jgi:hypothetical protein
MIFFDIGQDNLLSGLPMPWPLSAGMILLGFICYSYFKHTSEHWETHKSLCTIVMFGFISMGSMGLLMGLTGKYKNKESLTTGVHSAVTGQIEQHIMRRNGTGFSEFLVNGIQFSSGHQYFSESSNPKYRLRNGLNVHISYIPEKNTILRIEIEESDFKQLLGYGGLARKLCVKYESCIQ